MERRAFIRTCAGSALAAGLAPGLLRDALAEIVDFTPTRLVDVEGAPLKAAAIPTDEALVFAWPWRGTPCFLINLGARQSISQALESPDDGGYTSPPGVGPNAGIVAFIAICTHQLSYPTPQASVLRYAAGDSALAGEPGRIVCCAHGSVFDPAAGGCRVSGPAPAPLLPVRLAWDERTDELCATGTVGENFLRRFLAAYKSDLIERFGPGVYREDVGETTVAMPLSRYSQLVGQC